MKNVTITVEDGILEWTRVEAAKRGSSVSRMVGQMLAEKRRPGDADERADREWTAAIGKGGLHSGGQPYPRRDEIYAGRTDRFR
jgi:hypothetical protein